MAKSVPQSNTLTAALPPDLNSFSDGIETQTVGSDPVIERIERQPVEAATDSGNVSEAPRPVPSPYRPDADPLLVEIFEELEQIVVGQLLTPFARRHWATCNDLMLRVRERVKV